MKKTIYSKYSNDRKKEFQINTSIIEENGDRYVIKRPLTEEARNHINNVYLIGLEIEPMLVNSPFRLNQSIKVGDSLKFEYLSGKSLDVVLTEAILSNNTELYLQIIKQYCSALRKMATEDFFVTDEFVNVFGEWTIDSKLKCCKVTDIDLVFSNIVQTDGWNIIDYEWSFFFPIPIDYVIFRALSNTDELYQLNLFEEFGISKELVKQFLLMEQHFSMYVGYKKITKLYQGVFQATSLETLLENPEKKDYDLLVSECLTLEKHSKALQKNYQEAIADIELMRKRHDKDLEEKEFYHNKDLKELRELYNKDTSELRKYYEKEILTLKEYCSMEIDNLSKRNNELVEQLETQYSSLQALKSEYNAIINSKYWKTIQPIRKCIESLKHLE